MKNYIEYIFETREGDEVVQDSYHAVRPTPYRYRNKGREDWAEVGSGWQVFGGLPVYTHNMNDIHGLRGLLDEIEKELTK